MVAGTLQTKPIAVSTFNLKYVSFVCSRETIKPIAEALLSCGRALKLGADLVRTVATLSPTSLERPRASVQFISDIAGQDKFRRIQCARHGMENIGKSCTFTIGIALPLIPKCGQGFHLVENIWKSYDL